MTKIILSRSRTYRILKYGGAIGELGGEAENKLEFDLDEPHRKTGKSGDGVESRDGGDSFNSPPV